MFWGWQSVEPSVRLSHFLERGNALREFFFIYSFFIWHKCPLGLKDELTSQKKKKKCHNSRIHMFIMTHKCLTGQNDEGMTFHFQNVKYVSKIYLYCAFHRQKSQSALQGPYMKYKKSS